MEFKFTHKCYKIPVREFIFIFIHHTLVEKKENKISQHLLSVLLLGLPFCELYVLKQV